MATETSSIRLPDALVADARREAEVFRRTINGQLEHWARLGQAIEAALGFDLSRIRAALDGRFDPDTLSPDEMAIYEDLLGESFMTPSAKSTEFMDKLRRKGAAVGYDEAGRYVRSLPGGDIAVIKEAGGSEG